MSLTGPTATELKLFRLQRKLSQAALAEAIGSSVRAVEDWEGGRRPPPPMLRLALAAIDKSLEPWGIKMPTAGDF